MHAGLWPQKQQSMHVRTDDVCGSAPQVHCKVWECLAGWAGHSHPPKRLREHWHGHWRFLPAHLCYLGAVDSIPPGHTVPGVSPAQSSLETRLAPRHHHGTASGLKQDFDLTPCFRQSVPVISAFLMQHVHSC